MTVINIPNSYNIFQSCLKRSVPSSSQHTTKKHTADCLGDEILSFNKTTINSSENFTMAKHYLDLKKNRERPIENFHFYLTESFRELILGSLENFLIKKSL